MEYLERNRLLIAEIRENLELSRGGEIARSDTGTLVYSLGHYQSRMLGKELYLALKDKESHRNAIDRFVAQDLGLIRVIEQRFPHLLGEFPVVHGVVRNSTGKPLGVITEDFTQGRKYPIRFMNGDDKLPVELSDAFTCPLDLDELATTCFLVNGKRRIGDFGEFYKGLWVGNLDTVLPSRGDIYRNIGDYTLQVKEK